MENYYFNNNTDSHGRHEIHTESCSHGPAIFNRTKIGSFSSCSAALRSAQNSYPLKSFDGCYYCCNECHKG
ncbi:MAG: hypothetical protein ACRC1T_12190 [Clostridium chrysemydis]|uniref:hypothetical protein n=1 Tax=Clostridium chrysemydis TaxID=2665504 RepID=UPI003F2D6206